MLYNEVTKENINKMVVRFYAKIMLYNEVTKENINKMVVRFYAIPLTKAIRSHRIYS